ncbi:hypothetical protein HHK36_009657 [Tetracentron sinense]|uniref:Hydroxyproline-rich glycoprotein family protein n=1 Tax=Tetracentron sinense TaxID=13715 RepID=A0A834ZGK1_TETSI|nr:hypothetical protein HHK36_033477 [Tetracentron sinense]KAF8404768.1 hypothetical protein HHK36_009657 [Tetracentron sinense]
MENQDLTNDHVDASRPSLGFPLGTALLLLVIFSLSGFFSCCYHWDKLQSLRRSFSDDTDSDSDSPQSIPTCIKSKQNQGQSLPVLMPGDRIPKFIALPCPCKAPRLEKIAVVVEVQKPCTTSTSTSVVAQWPFGVCHGT